MSRRQERLLSSGVPGLDRRAPGAEQLARLGRQPTGEREARGGKRAQHEQHELIAILVTLLFAGDRAQERLTRGRGFLQRRWPNVLAGLLLLGGLFIALAGARGLAAVSQP